MLEEELSLGYLSRYAYRAFVKAIAMELGPLGILSSEWSVLRVLWLEEGYSQIDLALRMRVEKASLTGVLNGMESKGLIVRRRDPSDRRKLRIGLTPRGRALKVELMPYNRKINEYATRGMSNDDVARLRGLLTTVIRNLEARTATQDPSAD